MNSTASTAAKRRDLGLAILRVVIGAVFVAHGAQKLFGFGIAGLTAAFGRMGVPLPTVVAPLNIAIELLGGVALIIGLLTRWAAVGLAIDMLGAMIIVHFKNGFFLPTGLEYVLVLCTACVTIALAGPGAFAADAMRASTGDTGAAGRAD